MTLPRFRNANCGRPPKLTEDEARRAYGYADAHGIPATAARFGVSQDTLRRRWRLLGLPGLEAGRVVRNEAARVDAHRRYLAGGVSVDELAAELRLSRTGLYWWWRQHGLALAQDHPRPSGRGRHLVTDPIMERAVAIRDRGAPYHAIYADTPDLWARFASAGSFAVSLRSYVARRASTISTPKVSL